MFRRKIYSLTFVILTFVLLVSTVYAWFSLGPRSKMEFIELDVRGDEVEASLYLKKNDETEVLITSQEDISDILQLGIPNDTYSFRIRLQNQSSKAKTVSITFKNVVNNSTFEEVDLRDAYILKNKQVLFGATTLTLTPNTAGAGVGYDGQVIKEERINNFLNTSGDMRLVSAQTLAAGATIDVKFDISFDYQIHSSAYTGSIEIDKLIVMVT